jgi:hypothetical protein
MLILVGDQGADDQPFSWTWSSRLWRVGMTLPVSSDFWPVVSR